MIKLNGEVVNFNSYNDGSCRAKIQLPFNETKATITWLYDNDVEFLYLYYLTNHLREQQFDTIKLIMPYVVNERQDRTKSSLEIFTLKYSSHLINDMGFDRVYIYDPHSYVAPALLKNVCVWTPEREINKVVEKHPDSLIFFPDEGSYSRLRSVLNAPVAFGVKVRNYETQKIESLNIAGAKEMIKDHDILLCDDILSRGSTTFNAAKALKELGANNIYVFVSHCEDTVLRPHFNGQSLLDIPDLITKVYTTNSILRKTHEKIEIIREF